MNEKVSEPDFEVKSARDFYNQRWTSYNFINTLKLTRCMAILQEIATMKLAEPKIIELGCGTGWLTNILGAIGPSTGVDLSDLAIREASVHYPGKTFIAADIMNWDYPREAFDVVVSHEMLEHVEDQAGYLRIAYGLLRKGGYLILTTPNKRTFEALSDEARAGYKPQPIEKWVTPGELRQMLSEIFEVMKVTTVIPGWGHRGLYRIASSYYLRAAMRRSGLGWIYDGIALRLGFGLHILAVCRK